MEIFWADAAEQSEAAAAQKIRKSFLISPGIVIISDTKIKNTFEFQRKFKRRLYVLINEHLITIALSKDTNYTFSLYSKYEFFFVRVQKIYPYQVVRYYRQY